MLLVLLFALRNVHAFVHSRFERGDNDTSEATTDEHMEQNIRALALWRTGGIVAAEAAVLLNKTTCFQLISNMSSVVRSSHVPCIPNFKPDVHDVRKSGRLRFVCRMSCALCN